MKNQEYDTIQIPPQLSEAVKQGIQKGKAMQREKRRKHLFVTAGTAAAVLILFFSYCFANPAVASEIPLIGDIFSKVEEKGAFPGNYSEKATKLIKKEVSSGKDEKKETEELVFSPDTDQGITITPTEVYCDGASLYLTMECKNNNKGGFGKTSYLAKKNGELSEDVPWDYNLMQINGTWSDGIQTGLVDEFFVGEQLDENTMIGRLKITLENLRADVENIQFHINYLAWDEYSETAVSYVTHASGMLRYLEGAWDLNVPVVIDREQMKEYGVNVTDSRGFGIEKVTVSPYEIQVVPIVPEMDAQMREELYSAYQERCREILGADAEMYLGEAQLSKEDPVWYGGFVIYNEKGEKIDLYEEEQQQAVYDRGMKKIQKLHFYLIPDIIHVYKCPSQEVAEKCSLFSYELEL